MPKAILSFRLPQELHEYKIANRGGEYHSFLSSFTDDLRRLKDSDAKLKDWDEVWKLWWAELKEYEIDPYDG